MSFSGAARFPPGTVLGERQRHVFFGYYDHTPFSRDDNLMLALRVRVPNRSPAPNDLAEIVCYDLRHPEQLPRVIGSTSMWCWQQGCRLRWFSAQPDDLVIYNRLVAGRYGCVIQNIHSGKVEWQFEHPIYDVSPDGRWALSLDFSRLNRLRPGYGYAGLPDESRSQPAPAGNGIWHVDFATGKKELLFSLAEAAALRPADSMMSAQHYFNHISINPAGDKFIFLHLWKGGPHGRYNRMLVCDRHGQDRRVLNDEGLTSHYCWKDADTLLACIYYNRQKMVYYEFDITTGKKKIVGAGVLRKDGHPSYSPDKNWILLDTYPDRYRDQHLCLYDTAVNKLIEIGRFFSPMSFWQDVRCDLHPRWSPSGKYICADIPQRNGRRAMAVLDMGHIPR